ncbi:hypothetical protein NM688_g3285 [Phlebia brevispora]|uniref:Uncharacterized protein n=1 Tax=Phlebia brevispora TaxID=194682 RepID=A0ACC1T6D2_9APHY|nr:hypothetical protein NM688_g3285 [Phlebia brevispora]
MASAPSLPKSYTVYRFDEAGGPLVKAQASWKDPKPGEVVLKVLACGMCGSDDVVHSGVLQQGFPRVPGHEIVGDIVAVPPGESSWKVGQRVGAPWNGGHCHECTACRSGLYVGCEKSMGFTTGGYNDGGYAEYCTVGIDGICSVPKDMDPAEAAPMMCAGVTTFKSIVYLNITPGSLVAVQGFGGLGHLAVQYARALGHRVAVISSSAAKKDIALKLGAHIYLDSSQVNVIDELKKLGGANLIITTGQSNQKAYDLMPGLAYEGKLLTLGLSADTVTFLPMFMSQMRWSVHGFLCGTAQDCEDTIKFSQLHGVRCIVERFPFSKTQEAFDRHTSARFRAVVVM